MVAKFEAACGEIAVINGLDLGKYKLIQYAAPCNLKCNPPVYFELDTLGCTRILEVAAGTILEENGNLDKSGEIDFCSCANIAVRVNGPIK